MNYVEVVFGLLKDSVELNFREIDDFLTNLDDGMKDNLIDGQGNVFTITKDIIAVDEIKGECECNYTVEVKRKEIGE